MDSSKKAWVDLPKMHLTSVFQMNQKQFFLKVQTRIEKSAVASTLEICNMHANKFHKRQQDTVILLHMFSLNWTECECLSQ